MNKFLTLFIASILTTVSLAQAPELMSYQAVVRDAGGNLVASSSVGMQISILQGSPSGTAAYVETQVPTSNQNGLVTIEIGGGTVVSGNFATIDWENGPYYVKTETDPNGGTSYTITGTSQLLSVPYALNAGTDNDWDIAGSSMTNTAHNVGIGTNTPDTKLHVNGDVKLVTGSEDENKVLSSDVNGNAEWKYALTPIKSGFDSWYQMSDGDNYVYESPAVISITPAESGVISINLSGDLRTMQNTHAVVDIGYKVTITNFNPSGTSFDNRTSCGSQGSATFPTIARYDSWDVNGTYNVVAGVTYYIWFGAHDDGVVSQSPILSDVNCVVTLHTANGL